MNVWGSPSWGPGIRTPTPPDQTRLPCQFGQSPWSPRPVLPRARHPYKGQAAAEPKASCPNRDLNPDALMGTSTSSWRVCLFRHPDLEPPPGADPGRRPYEGRAATVRGGIAEVLGLEPRLPGPEPDGLPITPYPMGVGRAGFEPARRKAPRFEFGRSTSSTTGPLSALNQPPWRLAVLLAWQLAQTTSHFAISRRILPQALASVTMRAMPADLSSPVWSNWRTMGSGSPQSTHGWVRRYSSRLARFLARMRFLLARARSM